MFVSQRSGVLIPRQRGPHDLETSSLVPRSLPDLSGSHHYWINSGNEPKKQEDLGLSYPKYRYMASLVPGLGMGSERTPSPYNVEALLEFCTAETESKGGAILRYGVM